MKDKKQELELSYISESSQFRHKILDRAAVDAITEQAMREIKGEDVEMKWIELTNDNCLIIELNLLLSLIYLI